MSYLSAIELPFNVLRSASSPTTPAGTAGGALLRETTCLRVSFSTLSAVQTQTSNLDRARS